LGVPVNMLWKLRAACKDMDTDIFFPVAGDAEGLKYALSICEQCSVRQECLDYILQSGEDTGGIWGGTTGRERIRIHNAWRRR
jgi:WhiB family transcriptional regulator, redox-sensing transcriptional regulator